jgi:hypothetical protein
LRGDLCHRHGRHRAARCRHATAKLPEDNAAAATNRHALAIINPDGLDV